MKQPLTIIISFMLLATITACGNSPSKSKAFDFCKKEMKSRLKSPSSAVFSSIDDSTIMDFKPVKSPSGKVKTEYFVKGYVDSQNGYGAMIRTKYNCTVTGDDRGEWEVTSIFNK